MAFVTHQLQITARCAFWLGAFLTIAGAMLLSCTGNCITDRVANDDLTWTIYFIELIAFLVPGIALIFLSRCLERGALWAYFVIVGVACVESPLGVLYMLLSSNKCTLAICLLYLSLAAACWNAWPDAWRQYRKNRVQPRGFEVIAPGRQFPPPPPPSSSLRRARKSNDSEP